MGAGRRLAWRPLLAEDLPAVEAIADVLHPTFFERPETVHEKLRLCPDGCLAFADASGAVRGYGLSYPWRLDDVPPLDTFHGAWPADATLLYVHDVAILPEARGEGGAGAYLEAMRRVARMLGLQGLALTSVYGTVPLWAGLGFTVRASERIEAGLAGYGAEARYMTASI
ncbi:MAG: GNAT family N-acetyltransferase [Methylobacteriaceae bacterium]|nr:GNAT family N-acetyltransferase [Methylobacteriaceae bacterium]